MRRDYLAADALRAQAAVAALAGRSDPRIGIVTSYDPNRYAVRVSIQPEGFGTGWLPLASPWIGNGWGMFAPPSIGDMIEVGFQEGSPEAGYACLRFYSTQAQPLPCPSGEFWLVHQSGSRLKLCNDGSVELAAAGVLKTSAQAWQHTGPMSMTGNMTVQGSISATGDVVGGSISLDSHHHTGVQTGGGNTGGPTS